MHRPFIQRAIVKFKQTAPDSAILSELDPAVVEKAMNSKWAQITPLESFEDKENAKYEHLFTPGATIERPDDRLDKEDEEE